jgi:hypothetical protein
LSMWSHFFVLLLRAINFTDLVESGTVGTAMIGYLL